MTYAHVSAGAVVETYVDLPDVWESISGFHHADAETLAACGFLPIVEQRDPVGDGQVQDAVSYEVQSDQVIAHYPARAMTDDEVAQALASAKESKKAEVDDQYQARMGAGFPWNFGTDDAPDMQTLQTATPNDMTNWLTLKDGCRDAVAAGAGDMPVQPPLRCTSNAQFSPTINQVLVILAAMRAWGGTLLGTSWALKNAVDAATTNQEVSAIDAASGWPA